jgi:hypothetical protein
VSSGMEEAGLGEVVKASVKPRPGIEGVTIWNGCEEPRSTRGVRSGTSDRLVSGGESRSCSGMV